MMTEVELLEAHGLRVESRIEFENDEPMNNVKVYDGRKLIADITEEADTNDILLAFAADAGVETEID